MMKDKYVARVCVPEEAPEDYRKHMIESLVDRTILNFRDMFLDGDGIALSIKVEETHDGIPNDIGLYEFGTVYSTIAHVSRVERVYVHEGLNMDALQHDYRYAKLGDILKHKIGAWLKGKKR